MSSNPDSSHTNWNRGRQNGAPPAGSADESEPAASSNHAAARQAHLPPDPWLDAPEPGRLVGQAPSLYGAGPQEDGGSSDAAAAGQAAQPTAGGTDVPDPWTPKATPPPAPMPTVAPPGGWPIPRLTPREDPAPMPTVAPEHPDEAAYEIPRLPVSEQSSGSQEDAQPLPPVPQQPAPPTPAPALPTPAPALPTPAPALPTPAPAPQHPEPEAHSADPGFRPQPGQPYVFTAPPAPQTGAFAVPQNTGGMPVPRRVEGRNAPPSIMPLDLSQAALVRQRKEEPTSGWRRALYKASFGGINPGISKEQTERNALLDRVRTPIQGCHKIAVVSLKGGIGKTTTTSCLGLTLAHYRGDRVVALDANPDAGTLAERLTGVTDVSVRTMLDNMGDIRSFTDISRYMSLAGRLQVLASDQDAEISEAFDAEQYTQVTELLARYYNVVLTDSGTGMLHSAMKGTLEEANSLVVVGAPSVDGASRASKTLDWLVAHGYGDLVAGSVAVISSVRERSDAVDMNVLRSHFGARCRAVVEIPYDPHLVVGGRIDMAQLKPDTELAYIELAAAVADGFRPLGG